ncbi:hypothetical protein BC835DRAFT_632307 [Cytidiella melzeri]|nr:hypothetical protein BC835DRAFT_632307 [Cytidiella melzeri]
MSGGLLATLQLSHPVLLTTPFLLATQLPKESQIQLFHLCAGCIRDNNTQQMPLAPRAKSQTNQATLEIDAEDEMANLSRTLKANPESWTYDSQPPSRLEGGHGRHLPVVAKHAPNVAVLSLQADCLSRPPTSGFLPALPCFNPKKVYLHADSVLCKNLKSQANARAITNAVVA